MDRELLLLGLLRREDMHGYQLHEFINQNLSSCVDLKKPTAYFLLDKMAESGWILEVEEQQEGNRPARHVYQLTPEGEAAFQRLLRENLSTYHSARFLSDIGLAFLDTLEPAEAIALLNQRRGIIASELANAEAVPAHSGSSQLVIEHLVRHLRTEHEWLNEVIGRLEKTSQGE
ncbi:MAG: helix-turn-helix transcriptional regulator [Chloroflexota bacterium]